MPLTRNKSLLKDIPVLPLSLSRWNSWRSSRLEIFSRKLTRSGRTSSQAVCRGTGRTSVSGGRRWSFLASGSVRGATARNTKRRRGGGSHCHFKATEHAAKILIQLNYDSLCCRPTGYIVHTCDVHKRSLLDYTLLPGKFQTNTKYRPTQRRHLKLVVRHTPTFVFSVVKAD